MAGLILFLLLIVWTLYGVLISMSVSQADYDVLDTLETGVEIRAYPRRSGPPQLLMTRTVPSAPCSGTYPGTMREAKKIEMTTPVVTARSNRPERDSAKGEKIEMTAPVVTMNTEKGMLMAFYNAAAVRYPEHSNAFVEPGQDPVD